MFILFSQDWSVSRGNGDWWVCDEQVLHNTETLMISCFKALLFQISISKTFRNSDSWRGTCVLPLWYSLAISKSWFYSIQVRNSSLSSKILPCLITFPSNNPAAMVIDLSKIIHDFHSHAAPLERSGSRSEGVLAPLPVGITKTLIVHLEGGRYLGNVDRLALSQGDRGIISARICSVVTGRRNAELSGFTHTQKGLCLQRGSPSVGVRWGGYTLDKHQRDAD